MIHQKSLLTFVKLKQVGERFWKELVRTWDAREFTKYYLKFRHINGAHFFTIFKNCKIFRSSWSARIINIFFRWNQKQYSSNRNSLSITQVILFWDVEWEHQSTLTHLLTYNYSVNLKTGTNCIEKKEPLYDSYMERTFFHPA